MTPLLERLGHAPVTGCVLIAILTLAALTDFVAPTPQQLLGHGAAMGFLVQDGEPWRLLTYAFLHGGLIHLAFNTIFLLQLGPQIEAVLGSPRFALVYLCSAAGGGLVAVLWQDPHTLLVGASGAIFGILGAALAWNVRSGRSPLDFWNYEGPRQLVGLIVVNLALGFLFPMVSNAGHIGGLIAGFVTTHTFLLPPRDGARRVDRWIRAGWLALAASLTFYACEPFLRWDHLLTKARDASTPAEQMRWLAAIQELPAGARPPVAWPGAGLAPPAKDRRGR